MTTPSEHLAALLTPQAREAVRSAVGGLAWLLIRALIPRLVQILLEVLATQAAASPTTAALLAELPRMPMDRRLPEVVASDPRS